MIRKWSFAVCCELSFAAAGVSPYCVFARMVHQFCPNNTIFSRQGGAAAPPPRTLMITLPVHLFHLSFKLFFSHTNSLITFGRPVVRIHEEWDDLLIVDEDNLADKERSDIARIKYRAHRERS